MNTDSAFARNRDEAATTTPEAPGVRVEPATTYKPAAFGVKVWLAMVRRGRGRREEVVVPLRTRKAASGLRLMVVSSGETVMAGEPGMRAWEPMV